MMGLAQFRLENSRIMKNSDRNITARQFAVISLARGLGFPLALKMSLVARLLEGA